MEVTSYAPKNSIPAALQTLLVDLNFLSQIGRNMKPCFSNRVIVDDEFGSRIYRTILGWFQGEGRINGIMKVEQIINNSIEAIENQRYREHLPLTINALNSARNGIDNLAYTYADDPDMKSRFSVLLQNIDIQLDRYRNLIKGFRPEDQVKSSVNNPSVNDLSVNNSSNINKQNDKNERTSEEVIRSGDFTVDLSKIERYEKPNDDEIVDLEPTEKIKRNPLRIKKHKE